MSKVKICYFSATGSEMQVLSRAYKKALGTHKISMELVVRSQHDLSDPGEIEDFGRHIEGADYTIMVLMGGKISCPGFDDYIRRTKILHVQPGSQPEDIKLSEEYSNDYGSEQFNTCVMYIKNGGVDNICHLLLYVYQFVNGEEINVPVPQPVLCEGIYHPDARHVFLDTAKYFKWYSSRSADSSGKLRIGIWFHQTNWLNGNSAHIDALIKEIEKQGCMPLCVFSRTARDIYLDNRAADEVADFFFKQNGKTSIDVLLDPIPQSLSMLGSGFCKIYPSLDVPVLQIICTQNSYETWSKTMQAVTPVDVSCSVAQPEFDGNLITVVVATREDKEIDQLTGAVMKKYVPVPERIQAAIKLAGNWARLRHISNKDRRVAIVFHHYPPRNDRLGHAVGLDTFQSVKILIDRLKAQGHTIEKQYESGEALAHEMLTRMTNDSRWLLPEVLAERAADRVSENRYLQWRPTIPEKTRAHQTEHWGKAPGNIFVHNNDFLINGIINGNVYIGLQPTRGYLENTAENLHNPELPPPHHYLAHYRWIRYIFKADAVIHVGKHGSLEWLPGKSVGLSKYCYPDLSIQDLPNIYPYIINNPGEGTQAKRRSYCAIIDHLTPPFVSAEKAEDLGRLDDLISEYFMIKKRGDLAKIPVIERNILEEIKKQKLQTDLGIDLEGTGDTHAIVSKAHAYINEVADTIINDGLHIFGYPPEGETLIEFLAQMTRLKNGDIPSLRDEALKLMGYDYLELCRQRGEIISEVKTGAQIIETGHRAVLHILRKMDENSWETSAIREIVKDVLGGKSEDIIRVLVYIAEVLRPNVLKTTGEIDAAINALQGKFVSPGPSGAVTRGMADILPTGRNFYSVDPYKIPTPEAWEVGKKLGDELVNRYVEDHGKSPESLGIVIWASPTMRTQGDDIAEVLYLMGVKPVWNKSSGRVEGLEIIPAEKLEFPRIDVTLRTSGMFRDAFPNVMDLIDDAVSMVVALKETYGRNFLKRNVELEAKELMTKEKIGEDESLRLASFRVFSGRPGCYGAGVNKTIDAKQWKDKGDLAEIYVSWGAYAYGRSSYGRQVKDVFRRRLKSMDFTVKNEDSREYDILSGDDYNSYHGGMNAAVSHYKGTPACSYSGSSADPRQVKVRSTEEEAKFVSRVRVLNPKWIEGMKRHGYKGAGDLSRLVDICFHWDATTEVMDDWMYEKLAETYALDAQMQEWFKEHNPYALNNIVERLLEAIQRNMWDAGEEIKDRLQELYLKNEGDIEELLDEE